MFSYSKCLKPNHPVRAQKIKKYCRWLLFLNLIEKKSMPNRNKIHSCSVFSVGLQTFTYFVYNESHKNSKSNWQMINVKFIEKLPMQTEYQDKIQSVTDDHVYIVNHADGKTYCKSHLAEKMHLTWIWYQLVKDTF